ncbi:MAG: histidine kinase [Acidobacteriota bacterium]
MRNRVAFTILLTALGAWLVLSFVIAIQIDVGGLYAEAEVVTLRAILWQLLSNCFWLLALPALVALARWAPIRAGTWPWAVPFHLVSAVVFAALHGLLAFALARLIEPFPEVAEMTVGQGVTTFLAITLHLEMVLYWGILGAISAYRAHRKARRREREAAALQIQLSEVRLQALEAQIQPHFFFNSLNTIAMMIRSSSYDQAIRLVADVGDLLRYALQAGEDHQTTLARELAFVERYLEVEKARFADRLTCHIEVADGLRRYSFPTLALQPLVENAVRHGIARDPRAGEIAISAWLDQDMLEVRVEDDGPGPPSSEVPHPGVGIGNTAARIRALYGPRGTLSLERIGDRTRATIRLPAQVLSAEAEP